MSSSRDRVYRGNKHQDTALMFTWKDQDHHHHFNNRHLYQLYGKKKFSWQQRRHGAILTYAIKVQRPKTARHARTAQLGGDHFGQVKKESKSAKFANKEVLKDFD